MSNGPKRPRKTRYIYGPRSKELSFEAPLCTKCNNQRTQPSDIAFFDLFRFLKTQEQLTEDWGVKWADIYGASWDSSRTDLFKYFAKHVGCTFASHGLQVPSEIAEWLMGGGAIPPLEVFLWQSETRRDYLRECERRGVSESWMRTSDIQYKWNARAQKIDFLHYSIDFRSFTFYIRYPSETGTPNGNIWEGELRVSRRTEPELILLLLAFLPEKRENQHTSPPL